MPEVMAVQDNYVAAFEQFTRNAGDRVPAWLTMLREASIARFAELGFPTTSDEQWRHTNVSAIATTPFKLGGSDSAEGASELIEQCVFQGDTACRLVFVDGRYSAEHSKRSAQLAGVMVCNLGEALGEHEQIVRTHFERCAEDSSQAFAALNTAFAEQGGFIFVPRGVAVADPIHLLFVSTGAGGPRMTHPRNLIVVEESGQLTVVETHAGVAGSKYFTNAVADIVAGENATVDHCKVERESEQSYHVSHLRIHQERSSNVTSHVVSIGGELVRNNIQAVLDGEGCHCTLNGLTMIGGDQHVDNNLWVEHAKPHCNSWEYFKNILDDRSKSVFAGRIHVRKDAQKTDAKQTNMNLLLSDDAVADSKPQLEIFADDVKCTHGATIGQVDPEAIFYLMSRGIGREAAKNVLVCAFAGESLDQIKIAPLREQLGRIVLGRLSDGHLDGKR